MHKIPSLLIVAALTAASTQTNATTLTFATSGGVGVGASSDPILDFNPNIYTAGNNVLRSGGSSTVGYGSNVSASSANNGAYIVSNSTDATPTVSLIWSVFGGITTTQFFPASIEGVRPTSTTFLGSGNGVLQVDNWGLGAGFSVDFIDSNPLNQIALDSFDFYRSSTSLVANRGHGYNVTVTGSASGSLFSGSLITTGAGKNLFNLGVLGAAGESLTLTVTRPSTNAAELALVQASVPTATAVDGTTNQSGIDNLTFRSVTSVPAPDAFWLFSTGLVGLLMKFRRSKTS